MKTDLARIKQFIQLQGLTDNALIIADNKTDNYCVSDLILAFVSQFSNEKPLSEEQFEKLWRKEVDSLAGSHSIEKGYKGYLLCFNSLLRQNINHQMVEALKLSQEILTKVFDAQLVTTKPQKDALKDCLLKVGQAIESAETPETEDGWLTTDKCKPKLIRHHDLYSSADDLLFCWKGRQFIGWFEEFTQDSPNYKKGDMFFNAMGTTRSPASECKWRPLLPNPKA
jgi:hypothetical protein